MKLSKKLFAAAATLGLAAAATVGSTYAWFSMNREVTVTGMAVHTQTSDNLFVADTNSESAFVLGIVQNVNGLLEPVSTIDGANFFYNSTKNAKGDGSARVANTYTAYNSGNTAAFNTNYSTSGAVGYVDYAIYLKATPAADSEYTYLDMTKCSLTYNGTTITEKAWRAAIFAQSVAKGAAGSGDGTLVSIIGPSGATYFETGKAVSATDARDTVTKFGTKVSIATGLALGETAYFKVVVRLWLEGEDNTCNNDTFASLTNEYKLDLKFELTNAANSGTSLLESTLNGKAAAAGATGTASLDAGITGETITDYQWYNVSGNALIADATSATYTATATGDYYCLITTDVGHIYRTNSVHLVVA